MDWFAVTALGACGGAVVQAVDLAASVSQWRQARHDARLKHESLLPKLSAYVDMTADALVLLTRLVLGALAGLVFHGQIDGATAAVAVGASAPALLRQLGTLRTSGAVQADGAAVSQPAASIGLADVGAATAHEEGG